MARIVFLTAVAFTVGSVLWLLFPNQEDYFTTVLIGTTFLAGPVVAAATLWGKLEEISSKLNQAAEAKNLAATSMNNKE